MNFHEGGYSIYLWYICNCSIRCLLSIYTQPYTNISIMCLKTSVVKIKILCCKACVYCNLINWKWLVPTDSIACISRVVMSSRSVEKKSVSVLEKAGIVQQKSWGWEAAFSSFALKEIKRVVWSCAGSWNVEFRSLGSISKNLRTKGGVQKIKMEI